MMPMLEKESPQHGHRHLPRPLAREEQSKNQERVFPHTPVCLHKNKGSLPNDAIMLLYKETVQKFGQRKYTRHSVRKAKANADTEGYPRISST